VTTTTQTFIELADILSLRMECGKCHSTVTVPIARDMSFAGMKRCSNCGTAWLTFDMSTIEPQINACASAIRSTVDELNSWRKTLDAVGSAGFSLTIEITSEEPPEE